MNKNLTVQQSIDLASQKAQHALYEYLSDYLPVSRINELISLHRENIQYEIENEKKRREKELEILRRNSKRSCSECLQHKYSYEFASAYHEICKSCENKVVIYR